MRTIEVKVFKFSELSDKAKQKAKDAHAELFGYNWSQEAVESLQKLAEHFGGQLKDWQIDWFATSHSSAKFEMPEYMDWQTVKDRLMQLGTYDEKTLKGHGDCKLTGFCLDEDAIDGFRIAFMAGEHDLNKLMQAAFTSLLKAAQSDCEDQYSDETFGEFCDVNEYEFYEDGEQL